MTKTFDQIISTRRTVRHFDATKPITRAELMPILEAGRLAPSAKNFQPLRFVVVLSEEKRTKLHAISQHLGFITLRAISSSSATTTRRGSDHTVTSPM